MFEVTQIKCKEVIRLVEKFQSSIDSNWIYKQDIKRKSRLSSISLEPVNSSLLITKFESLPCLPFMMDNSRNNSTQVLDLTFSKDSPCKLI